MTEKPITNITYPIRLGQFLKLINYAQDGMEAKIIIQEGRVSINGHIERRRGKQLHKNDNVLLEDGTIYVLR